MVASWPASPPGSTAHRPAANPSEAETGPPSNGACLTTRPAATHLRVQPGEAAESLQSAQHIGEILDHRTEMSSIRALVRATLQFPTDDQDQLPIHVGPIRIGGA
jgi:hypothetical protein